jgi:transcriptional regulator with XRE-family HTH domain
MTKTLVEQYVEDPVHMRLFQQERAIYEVTELIESVMSEIGVTRSQLAAKLGQSKGWVTQLLDGEKNKTIRTVADVLAVLGREYCSFQRPIRVGKKAKPRSRTIELTEELNGDGGLKLYRAGNDYSSETTTESSPKTVELPMRAVR